VDVLLALEAVSANALPATIMETIISSFMEQHTAVKLVQMDSTKIQQASLAFSAQLLV